MRAPLPRRSERRCFSRLICRSLRAAERIENAVALAACCRNAVENIARTALVTRQYAEAERGQEEQGRKDRGGARQRIGRAAGRHEARTAANTEAAAFRALDEHDANKGEHDHEMDDNQYCLHGSSPARLETGINKNSGGSLHEAFIYSKPFGPEYALG